MLLEKLTDICADISPEYILFKLFHVPYIEKDNYVIISAPVVSSQIEYFSFLTGERIKVINTSHTDISELSRINNILISCSGYDETTDYMVELFDITTGTLLRSLKTDDFRLYFII